jgi:hypothetical protein
MLLRNLTILIVKTKTPVNSPVTAPQNARGYGVDGLIRPDFRPIFLHECAVAAVSGNLVVINCYKRYN